MGPIRYVALVSPQLIPGKRRDGRAAVLEDLGTGAGCQLRRYHPFGGVMVPEHSNFTWVGSIEGDCQSLVSRTLVEIVVGAGFFRPDSSRVNHCCGRFPQGRPHAGSSRRRPWKSFGRLLGGLGVQVMKLIPGGVRCSVNSGPI